ncbi:hypothetical protein BMS90_09530, partial [Leuconostoc mesenteroides subsp. mesenteroides]
GERSEFTKPFYSGLVLVAVVSPPQLTSHWLWHNVWLKAKWHPRARHTSAACLIPLAGLGNTAKNFTAHHLHAQS